MIRFWIATLHLFSRIEGKISDRFGESVTHCLHFLFWWATPIILGSLNYTTTQFAGMILAFFYILMLTADIFLSVFGHEELEMRRGLLDIRSFSQIREELTAAFIKYMGLLISFATVAYCLDRFYSGAAYFNQSRLVWDWPNFLYFSAITITTVGYGDIYPVVIWGKLFAMLEVLIGTAYLVLMFTMLVSIYISLHRSSR
ncbi:MAG: potassium channel family protein [Candidatus Sumerlaeota bacterium]|nr:potassium channel family protein [Candidatus Sumerlaeota bacterium]